MSSGSAAVKPDFVSAGMGLTLWDIPIVDKNGNSSTSRETITITVPPSTHADLSLRLFSNGTTNHRTTRG